jgi:hypothetical protein
MRERLRPVPRLEVDDGAAPGGLGPADKVTGRRVLPGRTGPFSPQHLVTRLPERPGRSVRPQQRHDVRGEHRAAVQLVAQLKVIHPGTHRMINSSHSHGVPRVPEPRVGPGRTAQRPRRVVVAPAQHLRPARPGRPPGQRVMQEHESLPRVEQLRKPASHRVNGRHRPRCGPALQDQPRQVITQDRIEHPQVLRAQPVLRCGLDRVREHPAAFVADAGQHAGERVQVDPVPPGHGQDAHAKKHQKHHGRDGRSALQPPCTRRPRRPPGPSRSASHPSRRTPPRRPRRPARHTVPRGECGRAAPG